MSSNSNEPNLRNSYMDQVMAQQQQVEVDLKAKRVALPAARMEQQAMIGEDTGVRRRVARMAAGPTRESLGSAVDVRITGFWRWKTVVVPPNAYVVHTRRGASEPLHLGLGISFRFDPMTDSFLVVPGTMQTILINAYCICRELQGLLVQGYVQWIIADFGTAYKKLDFSDVEDPMRVVNVQLREQAEAAIKDKVATMGIDDVLSDKQPIIEELTARLRAVAEGEGSTDKGLGLRIVTVQIKEAVVSSTRVWENLQKPFRAERARVARLAELAAESAIQTREAEHTKEHETRRLEVEAEMAKLRAAHEAETFDREQTETMRRKQREAEALARTAEMERARIATEADLETQRAAAEAAQREAAARAEIALAEARDEARNRQARAEVELLAARQRVHNDLTSGNLEARLIESLPLIAEKLPQPKELKAVTISGANGHGELGSLVAQLTALVDTFRTKNGA